MPFRSSASIITSACDAERADAGGEDVGLREREQRRVPARAPAGDRQPLRIDAPAVGEEARRRDGVLDVDDAPAAAQSLEVLAAEPGRAAVVQVEERDPAARPEL